MTLPDYDTDFYAWTQTQAADRSGAHRPGVPMNYSLRIVQTWR
jgi:hypothetical protein